MYVIKNEICVQVFITIQTSIPTTEADISTKEETDISSKEETYNKEENEDEKSMEAIFSKEAEKHVSLYMDRKSFFHSNWSWKGL